MTTQPDPTAAGMPDAAAPAAEPSSKNAEIIGRLASFLRGDDVLRGDLAALRRLDPERPNAPAFWRLLAWHGVPVERLNDDSRRRWGLVLRGMALMVPHHHDGHVAVGTALHAAGYAESRLGRLLNARGDPFRALVPRLCRQLAAKGQPLNWRELGRLILTEGRDEKAADAVRVAIARSYYAAESQARRTTG